MSRVSRAVERLIPHVYNYGEPYLQQDTIIGMAWLAETPNGELFRRFRRAAIETCGREVARKSWAVLIAFPYMHMPGSQAVAFVAKTKRGWRIYRPSWRVEYSLLPDTLLSPP